ncbi:FtsH protease activity modulator HflK [Neomegalonema sp.]|uniref:FtsH protease activity modulator HflK n=1 Tax=Neomegalonema sp. TaxID=2039713 RepID=UPI002611C9CC|nr:FtsH protease activity modulator HflK [Neomegalonema sp.]MDD2868776.1 FtsH protease activity modulator HflK [Neomegalonema sp.]
MPWSNDSGGPWGKKGGQGDRGRGPWGSGPSGGGSGGGGGGSGGGGDRDPQKEVEELFRRGRERMRSALGGGGGSGGGSGGGGGSPFSGGDLTAGGLLLGGLAALGVWLFLSIYTVDAGEEAVVLRFGQFHATATPGLNMRIWPIDTVEKVRVTEVRQINIGGETSGPASFRNPRVSADDGENLMLTGDENIIDLHFKVQWRIGDAPKYLFSLRDPETTVKAVAESAMREVVGRNNAEFVRTTGRQLVMQEVRDVIQTTLDSYDSGILIADDIQLEKADPPAAVIEAFRDVQAAQQDQVTAQNQAEAYRNQKLAGARGQSAQVAQEAEGYRAQVVAEAQGEASRFGAIYLEYRDSPAIVRTRMYLESMERALSGAPKVILDQNGVGGAVPFLPLNQMTPSREGR